MTSSNTDMAVLERDRLRDAIVAEGQELAAYGTGPIVLRDPATCWFVAEGSADIFATHLTEQDQPEGMRQHLFSASAGDILLGGQIDDGERRLGLILNGNVHTRLFRISTQRLFAAPALAADLRVPVERWIANLDAALVADHNQKPVFRGPVTTGLIEPSECYTGAKDVAWVQADTPTTVCNITEIQPGEAWFPLAEHSWLSAPKPAQLTVKRSSELDLMRDIQPGLRLFQSHAMQGFAANIARLETRARAQQDRRSAQDAELLSRSFADAVEVSQRTRSVARPSPTQSDLAKVVDFLAGVLKVDPSETAAKPMNDEGPRPLYALLGDTNLSSREIQLTDGWWKGKSLPLIVRTAEGHPLAIWSPKRSGAMAYDPRTGETRKVDAALAETLIDRAHTVYPTLLQEKVGFRDLFRTGLRGSLRDVVALLVFGIIGGLISLLTPSLMATLINVAIPHAETGLVMEVATVLISVAIVTALFQFLQATSLLRIETLFESQAQSAVWHRLLRMPSGFFRRFNSANLTLRALGLSQIRTVLSRGIAMSALGAIFSLLNLIVMIYYGGWLTLAALILTALTLLVAVVTNLIKLKHLRGYIAAQEALAGFSNQALTGIRKLRIAGAEDRVTARLISHHNEQRKHYYNSRRVENLLRTFNTVIPLLSTVVFFAVIEFIFDAPPNAGNFVAFAAAYGSFMVGITGLLNSVPLGLIALIQYERIKPILDTAPEKPSGEQPPGKLTGRIEVNRLSFGYEADGPPVLDDISLDIQPGQFVAIVGASGSGKSTLLRLLLGFEQPQNGSILYDGKDLSRLDIAALRRQFAVVLQENQILGGTILENIAGSRPLTLEQAWEAAAKVGLDQTIRDMPMQMHTVVNDGSTLSGGEKQRLMLARALAGTPRIMFMDEATSSLDNATQATVADSLSGIEMTRIVIAHRLSTVKDADRIFVMEAGKIVEAGTADELIAKGDHFARFVERQQFEY
ncbi:NHLP bacteriocin export ABC transporter permease/ATPase subunit [Ruegeria jejuensis]|uniref:NHLP bacteriocin export ABC transporter permease/ATPase subunit n=1 Tax=Ruegeria jejuensis TaxID=3233338 RepID=UPI00355B5B0E